MRWSTSKIPRPLNNILISDFWASAWMQMLKSTDVWPPLKQLYHFFTEEVLESLLNLANGFHDGASPSFWQNLMVSLFMLCYHFTMYWNPKSTHYMFSYMGSNVNWRFLQSAKKKWCMHFPSISQQKEASRTSSIYVEKKMVWYFLNPPRTCCTDQYSLVYGLN